MTKIRPKILIKKTGSWKREAGSYFQTYTTKMTFKRKESFFYDLHKLQLPSSNFKLVIINLHKPHIGF